MERLQQAPASRDAEDVPDLPLPPDLEIRSRPLLQRLDALRDPEVTQQEVDQFLQGLSTILPAHESPRERADLMLDILEDSRLCELTGTNGTRVGPLALEVLLELGYPYALEITPTMLNRGRVRERPPTPRSVFVGLGVAGTTALLYLWGFLTPYLTYASVHDVRYYTGAVPHPHFDYSVRGLPIFLGLLLGPALLTGLTWPLQLRGLRAFFNLAQWLSGLGFLLLGSADTLPQIDGNHPERVMWFLGTMTLVSAFCMRPRLRPVQEPPAAPKAEA